MFSWVFDSVRANGGYRSRARRSVGSVLALALLLTLFVPGLASAHCDVSANGVSVVQETRVRLEEVGGLAAVGSVIAEPHPATVIAQQTATIEAQLAATAEAIQTAWQHYFWSGIYDALSAEVAELPDMSVEPADESTGVSSSLIPGGYEHAAEYRVSIDGDAAAASVTLAIFPSSADADSIMETMSESLISSGWKPRVGSELDHKHSCLIAERSGWSEAVCYMTRDDALIIGYSTIGSSDPDTVLTTAVDLAKAMSAAYDDVDRPE